MAPIKREDEQIVWANHVRVVNSPIRFDAKTARIETDLPGFSYSNFNRVGYINFWSLLKSIEAPNRVIHVINPEAEPYIEGVSSVFASQVVEVNPKMYEDAAVDFPVTVVIRPGHVDNRFYSYYTELINKKKGLVYVRCQQQEGLLDHMTKRGIPLTDQIKQFRERVKDPSAETVVIARRNAPDDALKYHMKIAHSDTDQLYHSNQTSYFRYCLDTAAEACHEDKLFNFQGDFCRYKVSRAEIVYRRESHPGDDLEVTLWEDQNYKDTLHFFLSVNNDVVCIVNLTFFPEQPFPLAKI